MQLWYHFGSNLGASNIPRNSMKTRSIQQTFFSQLHDNMILYILIYDKSFNISNIGNCWLILCSCNTYNFASNKFAIKVTFSECPHE